LEIDELFAADEPVSATITTDDSGHPVDAVVADAATGRPVVEAHLTADGDGAFRASWPPLPPGDYRLTVAPTDSDSEQAPAHKLFMVAEPQ
jgi:hypothetical protein